MKTIEISAGLFCIQSLLASCGGPVTYHKAYKGPGLAKGTYALLFNQYDDGPTRPLRLKTQIDYVTPSFSNAQLSYTANDPWLVQDMFKGMSSHQVVEIPPGGYNLVVTAAEPPPHLNPSTFTLRLIARPGKSYQVCAAVEHKSRSLFSGREFQVQAFVREIVNEAKFKKLEAKAQASRAGVLARESQELKNTQ